MYKRIIFKDLHLPDLKLNVCGRRACTPGYTRGWVLRDHFLMHYVLSGRGVISNEQTTYCVKAGDLVICHPGERTRHVAGEQEPYDRIWVSFSCSAPIAELLQADVIHMPSLAPAFLKLVSCDKHNAKEWAANVQMFEILSRLADQQPSVNQPKDYVSQAVNFIESNYDQHLRVEELAAELGLSRSYFCRIFREKMGVSPQEYIISYRLEKAVELLTVKRLTQKEVARQVGYPDVYAFSRMFKRKYGMSPGKYRSEKLMNKKSRDS